MGDLAETDPAPAEPYPWTDLRLWATPLFAAGLAAVANTAWSTFIPGRAAPTVLVALAAALVAAAAIALGLHPRAAAWTAEGNVLPSVVAVIVAAAVAPPVAGPRFWAFGFTAGLLLLIWARTRELVRSIVRLCVVVPEDGTAVSDRARAAIRSAGERPLGELAGAATLDALLLIGALLAICDAGAGPGAGTTGGPVAHVLAAAAACGGALALAAWSGRADALRRAAGEDAGVQLGFARNWWWAAAPAIALCLAVGAALPTYRAPLQSGGVSHLVMGWVDYWTGGLATAAPPPTPAQEHAQDVTGLILAAFCVFVLVVAWPAKRLVQRILSGEIPEDPDRQERLSLRARLRLWWSRVVERWAGRRRPAPRVGRWRPFGAVVEGGIHRRQVPERAWAPADDIRGRVRAAYANVLHEAGTAGLARQMAQTPRRFLEWLLPRATPARFPMESLTATYEEARFSTHPLDTADAEWAEGDARAAAYGIAVGARKTRGPRPDPALKWTAPRGVQGMRRDW